MAYLNSTSIKVFPTAHRAGANGNESAFRLSEKHIGELLTLPLMTTKFVKEVNGTLFIVLYGHIFEVSKSAVTNLFSSSSATKIWATINYRNINADFGDELAPVENSSVIDLDVTEGSSLVFKGIKFDTTAPASDIPENKYILVLQKSGSSWNVPDASRVRLLSEDVANLVSDNLVPISKRFNSNQIKVDGTGTGNTNALEVVGGKAYFGGDTIVGGTLAVGTNPTTDANITGTITRAVGDRDGRAIDTTYATTLLHPTADLDKLQLKNGDNTAIGDIITINNVDHADYATKVTVSAASATTSSKFYLAGCLYATTQERDSLCKSATDIYFDKEGGLHATTFAGKASNVGTTAATGDIYPVGVTSATGTKLYNNTAIKFKTNGDISAHDITANSYNATSDKRLKENIKTFEPHKSILDLDVVEFDFKADKSHHIGCIAQELKEICPEIVHKGEDGYLRIEENKIVYLLLDEVKKLRKEVDELKNRR